MVKVGSLAFGWLTAGIVTLVFGDLVKLADWRWLVAGYIGPPSTVPVAVVRVMAGNTLLRLGVAVTGIGVLASVIDLPSSFVYTSTAALILDVLRLLYRLNTWSSRSEGA